ncbi:DUF4214 domain-containing protein [Pseudoduganella sp. GCM10020061]|uniref:DUF4214 domain-containing protein n=1 Tax=Pseudoduganella sp. GCM10020061 TaxID=3317345 RepID=UPI003627D0EF
MSQITVPLPTLYHVSPLIGAGPHWNLLPSHGNTIRYTFTVAGGHANDVAGIQAFTPTQQANARSAFEYISALTGIRFVETADALAAHVRLACADIMEADVAGLCISSYSYTDEVNYSDYQATSTVYIDNREWLGYAGQLVPGTEGYELLLHELGHMLGLKHPFEKAGTNGNTLAEYDDHTANTLMSYTSKGGPYSVYSQYDVAALMWLYGGDGLDGKLGVGGAGDYWMGTSANDYMEAYGTDDVLQGGGGDDVISGGWGGTDTAVFSGTRDSYEIVRVDVTEVTVRDLTGADGTDRVRFVELFQFSDGIFTFAQVTNADVTPPPAPVLSLDEANGKITIRGTAEPGARVEVFYSLPQGNHINFGQAVADASGAWSVPPRFVDNNSYVFYASATDASGNTSVFSAEQPVQVVAAIPATPTLLVEQDATFLIGGNRPVLYGTAHPGSKVEVYIDNAVAATALADAQGNWEALGNEVGPGTRMAWVVATTPDGRVVQNWDLAHIRVDAAAGFGGTGASDTFSAGPGNNTYSGGAGADSVAYGGPRAAYTVQVGERGVTVTDTQGSGGTDTLFSIERLHFGDAHLALDIGGNGGQAYRIYQAVFDRAPDMAGVGYWMARMDAGVALETVALGFMQSQEFTALYGADPSNADFVARLYQNVLDRAGEQAGVDFWVAALDEGRTSRTSVLAHFSESAENIDNLAAVIGNGFPYTPFG